jgi:hypothetical protein
MAAFVGFCVQANGIHFPYAPFDSITGSPPEQWDALPDVAKLQIIGFVGFLEVFSEHSFILEKQGEKHYMRGGKPGYFPELVGGKGGNGFGVHPVPLNLWGTSHACERPTPTLPTRAPRLQRCSLPTFRGPD